VLCIFCVGLQLKAVKACCKDSCDDCNQGECVDVMVSIVRSISCDGLFACFIRDGIYSFSIAMSLMKL